MSVTCSQAVRKHMVVCAPVQICGLSWCICVHVHLGLSGDFMPRSPNRCLACSLVYVDIEKFALKPQNYSVSIRTGVGRRNSYENLPACNDMLFTSINIFFQLCVPSE